MEKKRQNDKKNVNAGSRRFLLWHEEKVLASGIFYFEPDKTVYRAIKKGLIYSA